MSSLTALSYALMVCATDPAAAPTVRNHRVLLPAPDLREAPEDRRVEVDRHALGVRVVRVRVSSESGSLVVCVTNVVIGAASSHETAEDRPAGNAWPLDFGPTIRKKICTNPSRES